MKIKSGTKLQNIISYTVFYLSGFLILSPIHQSENIVVSLISAFFISGILLKLILKFYKRGSFYENKRRFSCKIISVIAVISSLFCCLMLITEIIKDVSYIADRGVSITYYIFTAIAILFVSYYLCISAPKGIFRFLILSPYVFLILFIIMFFSLFSVKSITANALISQSDSVSSIMTGIKSGIFFTLDTSVYLFCFDDIQVDQNNKDLSSQITAGFLISFFFISVYSIFTCLIFGKLTPEISDPDYALIKLIPGADFTEIISAVRIISFMIKSSCYIYLSAKILKDFIPKIKISKIRLIFILYISIPISIIFLSFFDKTLGYGAFQHLIYPTNTIMSTAFMILFSKLQKNK